MKLKYSLSLIMLLCCLHLSAQPNNLSLKGQITTAKNQPVPFASLLIKHSQLGALTDEDGNYSISNIPAGKHTLIVKAIGYESIEKEILLDQNSPLTLDLTLTSSATELQEVEVTGRKEQTYKNSYTFSGTKTETPSRYVPQSISYVTKEVIDDQLAFKANDIIKNVSGATQYSYYNNDVSLRGFRSTNALINGLRNATSSWSQSLLPNVERVEVIKGPASALFANTDPGGTVNTVTKKPLDESRKSINFATGSYNTTRISADFTGPMNENKTLLYRLNLAYQNAESFRVLQGGQDFVIAPSISFIPDEKTQVNFDFVYSKTNSRLDRGQAIFGATAGTNLNSTPISFAIGKTNDFENELNLSATASLTRKINDNITFNASYMKFLYDEDLLEHRTSNSYAVDAAGSPIPTKMGMISNRRQTKNYNDNLTLYFVSNFTTGPLKHKLVTGYDYILNTRPVGSSTYTATGYRKVDGTFGNYNKNTPALFIMKDGLPVPNVPHFDLVNPDYSISETSAYINVSAEQEPTKYYVNGIYIQDQIAFGKFQVLLGLRQEYYTDVQKYTEANEQKVKQNALIPRIGLVYTPFEPVSFYGTYTEGYQPQNAATVGAPERFGGPFDPLISTMYEVGAKSELFKKRLAASISFYKIEQNNTLMQLGKNPSLPELYTQIGQQRSKGIELDVNGAILTNLSLTASFAINRAETTKSSIKEQIGQLNPNAPKVQGGFWTKYSFISPGLKGLGIGVGVNHTGRRNTQSTILELPAYTLVNTALYYSVDKFKFSAVLNNVFDKTHWVGGYDFARIFPGAPRNFMIGIGYAF